MVLGAAVTSCVGSLAGFLAFRRRNNQRWKKATTGFLVDSSHPARLQSPWSGDKGDSGSMISIRCAPFIPISGQLSLTHVDFLLSSKYHLLRTAVKVSSLQLKIFDEKKNLKNVSDKVTAQWLFFC